MEKYNLGDINLRVYHYFLGAITELVSVSISKTIIKKDTFREFGKADVRSIHGITLKLIGF